jgi:hypothetical protein
MAHIDDLPFLVNAQVVLGILFSCVIHQPFYFTLTISHFFFWVFFGKFQQESFVGIWGHFESKIVGGFLGLFNEVLGSTSNPFRGIIYFFMEDCAPFTFLVNWALMVSYLCSRFCISIDPFWGSMFFKLKAAPTCFNHTYV